MIPASAEFHRAVAEGRPQRALLRFADGTVFTNEDISITSGGIHYDEVLNGETELTIGACPSSSIRVALINEDGRLNGFPFGQFTTQLGAMVESSTYETVGNVTIYDADGIRISGHNEPPYLRFNGVGASHQPGFPVKSLVLDEDVLFCIGDDEVGSGTWDGANFSYRGSPVIPAHTVTKLPRLAEARRGLVLSGNIITEYTRGQRSIWEYVPLGTFIAPRPAVVRTRIVDMEASDRMTSLDVGMPDIDTSAFPMTIGELLNRLCALTGITCVTEDFINRDVIIPTKPESFSDATAREVLGWIAQAACAYARFDREDRLELVWFSDSGVRLDESCYSEFTPCEYAVAPVSKLHIRNADSDVEIVTGAGDNEYTIQDNPLLRQAETGMARSVSRALSPADVIYERLGGFDAFHPISATTFYDWTIQAGDVLEFSSGGDVYRAPVYTMSLDWNGSPTITFENTGSEMRPPVPKQERMNFGLGGGIRQVKKESEEIRTWAQIQLSEQSALIVAMAGRLDEVEGDYSSALVRINGLEAEIDARVEKNGVIAAINMSAETGVLIEASRIDLAGYVTMTDFEAISAELDMIMSGLASVDLLMAEAITVGDLDAGEAYISKLTIPASGTLTIRNGVDLTLLGYKPRWNQMTVATGTITVTPELHRYNFMMADGSTKSITVMENVDVSLNTDTITYLYRGTSA